MVLIKPVLAMASILILLLGCGEANTYVAQQPTWQQANERLYYGGVARFDDEATGRNGTMLLSVKSDVDVDLRSTPNAIYFTTSIWAEQNKAEPSSGDVSQPYLETLPDKLLADANDSILQNVRSKQLTELVTRFAKMTICVDGTPALHQRDLYRRSLSPAQSQKLTQTLGGNNARI